MKKILVVGSINMDLVVNTDEIPKSGETIIGNTLSQIPGGKGANQAVAMAKLGKSVMFLGKVGDDIFGDTLLNSISESAVEITHIGKGKTSTGIAVINVDKFGNNNIVVIPGANWEVDVDYLKEHIEVFEESDIVLFQLEIPLSTVKEGLKISKRLGKMTILNPAPARDLDDETFKLIDILIPNEHELERMSGINVHDKSTLLNAANILLDKGVNKVIVTLGDEGVLYADKSNYNFFKSYKVDVVDTTAAGDSFIGGFTSSYIENNSIEKAIEFGQKTAALSIQKFGAQSSLPTLSEIDSFSFDTK